MREPVVITGRALATALGAGLGETWDALIGGRSGITPIEAFDASGFPCRMAATLSGIDVESMDLPRRESRIMDLHSLILMRCAEQAMAEAALPGSDRNDPSVGFFAAIGMVDYKVDDLLGAVTASRDARGAFGYDRFYSKAYREIFPLWPLSMLNNIALCQVAVRLGLRGENSVFSPHGDSALQALAEAVATVTEGRSSAVLAAGVGERVSEWSLGRALLHGVLNTRDQEQPCRPFAVDRAGTVLGEGGGVVVLEPLSRAAVRGKGPWVAVSGYGAGFGQGDPAQPGGGPSSEAIAGAMQQALQRAGRQPADIDLIVCHGDGTAAGDQREIDAIHRAVGESASGIRLYSSKGSLGNLLAGSPLVDVILAERMIKSGMIPATLNGGATMSDAGAMLVTDQPIDSSPRVILVNGFSYEGQAASLLIERVDEQDLSGAGR